MPKSNKQKMKTGKGKVYSVPSAQKKRDNGVPKLQATGLVRRQAMPYGKSKPAAAPPPPSTMAALAARSARLLGETVHAGPSMPSNNQLVDASLTTRDSSSKAFMRELRKVVERSDVIIQVLDARDPEGTRSRWVEDEVRKREGEGKKLLGVMNKIDLVPRANLEAWLRYLKHDFPCMPFKSSTQAQRQNLSQNIVPLAQTALKPGEKAPALAPLPTTSSSLGAPALLHLLKQYSLSTPHSSLTVGVVGYPNVGKSSLINSLKRSRACAVAAMPGKTRVIQEVVLDKGVKIVDCPGVVLEDFSKDMGGEEGRRKQAEIMLRNCIKAELVEDPIAPVEVILSKVDPLLLQKMYNIPPYDDVRDFLIKIALTRGRLGKGGIPDLEGSAVSVLRDWNSGKISYFTVPPAVHPSSAPTAAATAAALNGDVDMGGSGAPSHAQVGDAKILNTLSEAFTLDGLFDTLGDEAAWDGEDEGEDGNAWEAEQAIDGEVDIDDSLPIVPSATGTSSGLVPTASSSSAPAVFKMPSSDSESDADADDIDDIDDDFAFRPVQARQSFAPFPAASSIAAQAVTTASYNKLGSSAAADASRLFTREELAVMPAGMLDRQRAKQAAKKAKKRRAAAEQTEGELMLGFMGMDVEEGTAKPEPFEYSSSSISRLSGKQARKDKKKKKVQGVQKIKNAGGSGGGGGRNDTVMEIEDEHTVQARKEADFASFLANVGGDSDEEL